MGIIELKHGMGISSLSILLHELIKLVYYAKCKNVVFLRIGTSGGIGLYLWLLVLVPQFYKSLIKTGVEQGTIVITEKAVDGLLRPFYELVSSKTLFSSVYRKYKENYRFKHFIVSYVIDLSLICHFMRSTFFKFILGKVVRRPSICDRELVEELKAIAAQEMSEFPSVSGTTMCALDFYEAQARLDGAFCDITPEQKGQFLNHLRDKGVVNIEMEAIAFASMCHYSGIKGAIICVTLLNRLNGDQVSFSKEFSDQLQTRPQILAAKFIKKRLSQYEQAQL